MATGKSVYVCQSCGYRTPRWLGRCPDCDQWNSFVEERSHASRGSRKSPSGVSSAVPITEVESASQNRFATGIEEFDRILGGGVVPGSLVLVGGDPGIGKSTLMLQVASRLGQGDRDVLYVSGEESAAQTRGRAERLGALSSRISLFPEVDLERILGHLEKARPQVTIIDSVQTVYDPELDGAPGSVSQIRESTGRFLRLAKALNVAFFLVGHVTKAGAIAGPRLLEHMVDTVLYFEGDRHHAYRILRAVKNRFGSTNEVGLFQMSSQGLEQVSNPSKIFLSQRDPETTGTVVVGSLEGSRPLLLELQALVSRSNYNVPQRVVTGVEYGRLVMLLAVLEKKFGLRLGAHDVFVNVAGGIRVNGPAADLGIVTAIASSYRDRPVDAEAVVIGEVGLSGEVRAVSQPERRIREAEKLGFRRCLLPADNLDGLPKTFELEMVGVRTVRDALDAVLKGHTKKGD